MFCVSSPLLCTQLDNKGLDIIRMDGVAVKIKFYVFYALHSYILYLP